MYILSYFVSIFYPPLCTVLVYHFTFNIKTVYTDYNYAYQDKIPSDILVLGKKNTQKIERDHLTLRTIIKRLARKSICFSKDKDIHETVIGSFIVIPLEKVK